jgi:hypothetical protein
MIGEVEKAVQQQMTRADPISASPPMQRSAPAALAGWTISEKDILLCNDNGWNDRTTDRTRFHHRDVGARHSVGSALFACPDGIHEDAFIVKRLFESS